MTWDLPLSVNVDGTDFKIRNECDYRVILDVIGALNDETLTDEERIKSALIIFYEDLSEAKNMQEMVKEMFNIVSGGECDESGGNTESQPQHRLMDWNFDFPRIAPPVNKVLGYDIRTPGKYTHWYTLLSAYMEIGECTFSTITTIRSKRAKNKKLENYEIEFYKKNRKIVDLPTKLTPEEEAFLNSDW